MQVGSIVETIANFEELRAIYGLPYPKKGDVLTVSAITKHPNSELNKKGIVLLFFEEIPNLPGVCDKEITGTINFQELSLPDDIIEIIEQPSTQYHNI